MDTEKQFLRCTCRRIHERNPSVNMSRWTCACGEDLLALEQKLNSPRTAFLKKAIKARQLACELRNTLEELDSDIRLIEIDIPFTQEECDFEDHAAAVESVEHVLDATFPSDRFPSSDPLTWKEQD